MDSHLTQMKDRGVQLDICLCPEKIQMTVETIFTTTFHQDLCH